MKLEIRNLQSSATYEIDPEGAVLGREGAKADIVLRDQAVSKKHAKIYEKNGRWYLEDLASSNGTFVDNRRITEPVLLTPGIVFSLSENQFEVVQVVSGGGPSGGLGGGHGPNGKGAFDNDMRDGSMGDPLDDLPPLGMTAGDEPGEVNKKTGRVQRGAPATGRVQGAKMPANDLGGDDVPPAEEEKLSVGYFLLAVPKAIAYYMGAVPLMAVNPVGTVRKGIEEQRFPAMRWMQLAAYAMPAFAFAAALGSLAGFIAALIRGSFAFSLLIPGLPIGIVGGLIGALIGGFILHPVLTWIVNFLKGESDEKSRTNYFIMTCATSILVALPNALTTILAAVPLPFIGVVPVVVQLAASLVSFYVFYAWMKHFNVVAWFQKVLMVLGVLILLGAGYNLVMVIIGSISSLGSGGGAVVASGVPNEAGLTAEQKEAIRQAQEAAKAAAAAAGQVAGQAGADSEAAVKKAQEEAQKQLAAAQEASKKAMEEAAKAGGVAQAQIDAAKKQAEAAQAEAAKQVEAAKQAEGAHEAKGAEAQGGKKEEVAAKKEELAVGAKLAETAKKEEAAPKKVLHEDDAAGSEDTAASGEHTAFEQFLNRREAINKTIEKDPFLMRQKDVAEKYETLLRTTDEVRQRWAKKKAKDFAQSKVNERLKDIEVYEATSKLVDQLYHRLFQAR